MRGDRTRGSPIEGEPEQNVLVVVAEAGSEGVDAAGVARVGLHLDAEANRVMRGDVEVRKRERRDPDAVDEGAVGGDANALELAVLAPCSFHPRRRLLCACWVEFLTLT